MNNKTYDILKNIALVVLPALATCWLTVSHIWSLPYGEEIAATITAIDVFLGALLKISSYYYNDGLKEALKDIDKALDADKEDKGSC
jgi:hypothetical protein